MTTCIFLQKLNKAPILSDHKCISTNVSSVFRDSSSLKSVFCTVRVTFVTDRLNSCDENLRGQSRRNTGHAFSPN